MNAPLAAAAFRHIIDVLVELWNDESGATTLEYCAAGGVLSGITFFAFEHLKAEQTAALERVLEQIG